MLCFVVLFPPPPNMAAKTCIKILDIFATEGKMVKDEYRRDLPPKGLLLPFSLFTLHVYVCVWGD